MRGKPNGRAPAKASAKAAELKRLAHAAGATGNRLSRADRQLRDAAIHAGIACGETQKQLAEEFGISERQVATIATRRETAPTGLDKRPMQLVEEMLRDYRARIATLDAMAYENSERQPAVALGALKLAAGTRREMIQFMGAIGKFPTNLELFRSQAEMDRVRTMMIDKLYEADAGHISVQDVIAWLDEVMNKRVPLYDVQVSQLPRR